MQKEAAEEFVGVERQRAHLTAVPIVLPPKRDRVVGDGDEPVIGDGDAVRVPREVVQHVGGAAKGRLGVDHPRLVMERSEPRPKGEVADGEAVAAPNDWRFSIRAAPRDCQPLTML